jgi:hypothetical protein
MKLEKKSIILLAISLFLGGGIYFYETYWQPQQNVVRENNNKFFSFAEADIEKIVIEKKNIILEFQRTKDSNHPWQMNRPEKTFASGAAIAFLTDKIVNIKQERLFNISSKELTEYGFNSPLAKISFELTNKQKHQIILGKNTFNDLSIYAQIDPPNSSSQELKIILVPKNFQYAVERDLSEWKESTDK